MPPLDGGPPPTGTHVGEAETSTDWSRLLDDVLCDVEPEPDLPPEPPVYQQNPQARLIAVATERPGRERPRSRPRQAVYMIAVGVIAIVLLMVVAAVSDDIGNNAGGGAPPKSGVPSGEIIQFTDVRDHGSTVDLVWSGPTALQYDILVAWPGQKSPTPVVVGQRHTLHVSVVPGRPYCFEVQATNGAHIIETMPHAIRGARCSG